MDALSRWCVAVGLVSTLCLSSGCVTEPHAALYAADRRKIASVDGQSRVLSWSPGGVKPVRCAISVDEDGFSGLMEIEPHSVSGIDVSHQVWFVADPKTVPVVGLQPETTTLAAVVKSDPEDGLEMVRRDGALVRRVVRVWWKPTGRGYVRLVRIEVDR